MQYNLATVKSFFGVFFGNLSPLLESFAGYTNLTSTQGCIRGLTHACVCVEEGRGRGMLEGECAPPFVNFTSLKGT